jgi:uncharacterized protein
MTDKVSPVFEFKASAVEASGTFAGYASTFGGAPDSYGDIIAPGAFSETLKDHLAKASVPAMLWAHQTSNPIGRWTSLKENAHGLAVQGKLTLATQRGAEAHALMKDDALGLSIGFRVNPGGEAYQRSNRILKSLQLFEVSAVAIPANPGARVTGVKSAEFMRPQSIRDFEAALRDVCGFSVREAKRIASAGWPALLRRDDAEGEEIAAMLRKAALDFQS